MAEELRSEPGEPQLAAIRQHLSALHSALSRYLPQHLLNWLGGDHPGAGYLEGTVLFADVSGFTAMSEKLQALGREGAEEITFLVNDYFESMLAISDRYGGDVLKFGGDALLILFEGPAGPISALTAAQAMQDAMSAYAEVKTSQGVFPLRMKIGIGTGRILLAALGSSKQMNYAVIGRPLARMSEAEEAASAGQIIVDEPTRAATEGRISFDPVGEALWLLKDATDQAAGIAATGVAESTGTATARPSTTIEPETAAGPTSASAPQPSPVALELQHVERLSRFVPQQLLDGLVVDPERSVQRGSHRPVTVMFANFAGIGELVERLGPERVEAASAILNAYYERMSSIIAEFGGIVTRVDNYSTGQRILALFGALRAHEDDPQRAVAAGLEMNRTLAAVNQQIAGILAALPEPVEAGETSVRQRIGINSGFVFAGDVGGVRRREFTVMGDEVNLTARIMSVSNFGDVLIGDSTKRRVAQVADLEPQEAVKVKGKTKPVQTYVVRGMRVASDEPAAAVQTPLVGRAPELSIIGEKLQLASTGAGQLVAITADAGLGKSRLVAEALRLALARELAVVNGECRPYGTHSSYLVWDGIWRGIFEVDPSLPGEAQIDGLEAAIAELDPSVAPRLPLLGPLLNLPIPDNDLTRHFDAKTRKSSLEQMLGKLLQAKAQHGGLVMVLEDTHWIDPLSADLLQVLGQTIRNLPVLVFRVGREDPDRVGERFPASSWPHFTQIHLPPLTAEQSKQWIDLKLSQLYGAELRTPQVFIDRLRQRSEGNPFYIEEVLNSLRDRGVSPQDAEALSALDLPASLHGLVLSRIDELGERPRSTLQVASVFGREFQAPHLTGAYPDLDQVDAELSELEQKGFIEPGPDHGQLYLFKQGVIQEVAYESLSFNLRRSLHVNIGGFLERTYADSLDSQTDLLAHHYFKGEAWPKALDYKLESARKSRHDYANDAAVLAARNALEASQHLDGASEIKSKILVAHEVLGDVLGWQAQYVDSVAAYKEMLDIAGALGDSPAEARSWQGMAEAQMHQGDLHGAIDSAEHAEAIARDARLDLPLARARWMQGWGAFRLGEIEQALELTSDLSELSKELEDQGQRAENSNLLGVLSWASGDYAKAEEHFHQALSIFEEMGDVRRAMPLANNLAVIAESRGDYETAANGYNEALGIARQIGNRDGELVYLGNLGGAKLLQGDPVGAEADLREVLDLADPEGMDVLPDVLRMLAESVLAQGRLAEAFDLSSRALESAVSAGSQDYLGAVWRVLGAVIAQMDEPPVLEYSPLGLAGACDAGICFAESERILREIGREDELARTLRSWAMHEFHSGKRGQAEDKWKEAKGLFQKIGATHEVARMTELD